MSKISNNTVGRMCEIYSRYERGESSYKLAEQYGLCAGYISNIIRSVITGGMLDRDLTAFAGDCVPALKQLPARAYNMMRRNGVHNIKSARMLDRGTILSWRGCGDMIADEIMSFVNEIR